MNTIKAFTTVYKSADNECHVYFFPGRDERGHVTSKLYFLTKDIDYLYTRQSDGAIDYTIKNPPSAIEYRMTNVQTGEIKDYKVEV